MKSVFLFYIAPKFENLAPAKLDTDQKIKEVFKISAEDRTLYHDSIISEASFHSQFSTSNMSSIPALLSKSSGSKKRKTSEVVDLEAFNTLEPAEIFKKLQYLQSLGQAKVLSLPEAAKKKAQAVAKKVTDLKKITT
ncbi:hypothetical protein M8C21_001558 [Ambrosia artemisiifolia]|uniref:Uncharacterized protein n=1 Tax=Ambrosia artemisiifolia TaxID=4212 RepID=A0AAD5CIK6_AMBAR|nr:hypothetical protein M8C21_001558 [Ambrosia artemisiifolia]